jgi:phenylalanyl-tRNA synthetase beta chain
MKASLNWLWQLAGGSGEPPAADVATLLTDGGMEVEAAERVGDFSGVVVAEVRAARRHPKAEKLTLVEVFDGAGTTEVVCGAPNVPAAGGKVAWARPGARLPDGRVLEAREVRGVVSPGMLCAEDELGLGSSHEGILLLDAEARPGDDLARTLGLPDTIFELNATPNRPDWLGHRGVARELAALARARDPGAPPLPPLDEEPGPVGDEPIERLASLALEDPEGCPRYLARVVYGVTVRPSPLALRLRLQLLGVRAINNIVDATNLSLLETGHPLHAFDLDRLGGARIVVRRARAGEPIVTLDGQERRLGPEDVAICDAERPVAVAGVMGGRDSEVGEGTRRILLESASFDPARIRRTSKRLGLRTEASQRFERGADPNDGVALSSLRCDAAELLGIALGAGEQEALLAALELQPRREGERIVCRVPTFRRDLTREADLVEEVARLHGYQRVPATLPRTTAVGRDGRSEAERRQETARAALAALGFTEAITYAFVAPERIAALGFRDWRAQPIRVDNPLREEQSAMRTSLLPGLLAAWQRNDSFGVDEQRLFETGKVFRRREPGERGRALAEHLPPEGKDALLPEERIVVAGLLSGHDEGAGGAWLKPGEPLDFFDVKGVVEALLGALAASATSFRAPPEPVPWLHPGLGACVLGGAEAKDGDGGPVRLAGEGVGALGEVHPEVRARLGIEARLFAFEIDLGALGAARPVRAVDLPRFPGAARDVSFFVDEQVPAADLQAAMAAGSPLLESVRVLEDYRETGRVPPGRKGMLFSLSYRAPDRTLTDDEIAREHARVLAALAARFAIERR